MYTLEGSKFQNFVIYAVYILGYRAPSSLLQKVWHETGFCSKSNNFSKSNDVPISFKMTYMYLKVVVNLYDSAELKCLTNTCTSL